MISNPSIIKFNSILLEQAQLYGIKSLFLGVLLFALVYSLLNYFQWSRVAKKPFNWSRLKVFCLTETIWLTITFTCLSLSLFYVFDPDRITSALPVLLIIIMHLTFGLNLGLLKNKKMTSWRQLPSFIKKVFKPGLTKIWAWLLVYGLLIVVFVLIISITGIFSGFGTVYKVLTILILLLGLAWWRMTAYGLLTHEKS